tara:strand:+ start:29 stop:370 length:342 start_codon:yes stop_codon:yes gene_type:complete
MGRVTDYIAYLNDTAISEKDTCWVYLSFDDTNKRQRYEYHKSLNKKVIKPKKETTKILVKPLKLNLIKTDGLTETYQYLQTSYENNEVIEWIGTKKVLEDIVKIKWLRKERND